jgi:hypothetical protein
MNVSLQVPAMACMTALMSGGAYDALTQEENIQILGDPIFLE